MAGKVTAVIACVILLYYVFTSGLLFEATKSQATARIDIPWAISLSNYRLSVVGEFSDGDIAAAQWLKSNRDFPVYCDYSSAILIYGICPSRGFSIDEPNEVHYLMVNSWNMQHEQWVTGRDGALRDYQPLPSTGDCLLWQQGDTYIYLKGEL